MTQNKSLIAIVNARSRQENSWANAIRSTWMSQVPSDKADIKFFVGRGEKEIAFPNETVALDCDDSYRGLPEKVRAIIRYAKDNDYEYVMKLDDDVVVRPKTLLSSGYDNNKYSGRANRKPNVQDPFWVPMGFAYWMHRDAYKCIVDAELPPTNDDERWVAGNLYKHGITLTDERRYHLYTGGLRIIPPRLNRPLRIGAALQDTNNMANGFAFCVFFEVGGHPQRISTEIKIEEFMRLFRKYGEGQVDAV